MAHTATTGAALGGMALAGCSGDDDASSRSSAANAPRPAETPADGGTLRLPQTTEPSGLDPLATINITSQFVADGVYSRLVRFKSGPLPDVQKLELAPDLATAWESTPDFTQWRFTLRQGVTFHNKPPVNSRALTAEDVVKSFERVNALPGVYKSYLRDVDRVETPDDRTIVFKLKRANGLFGSTLANFGVLRILPREATGGFDPKTMMIGSGPWQFESYEPTRPPPRVSASRAR
jgi:peptide/nickel transport system substrate-binding protein